MEVKREEKLQEAVSDILKSYEERGELSHLEGGTLPNRETIWGIVEDLLKLLFPGFLEGTMIPRDDIAARTSERVSSLERRLKGEIEKGLRFKKEPDAGVQERSRKARAIALKLLAEIPAIRELLAADIGAAYEGDPAARSDEEIILAYPGLQAIAVHRMAHVLYVEDVPLVPRVMTEYAHARTGIDIHPGAQIGRRFFIDHGTGVVIGETTQIGKRVRIYQGVTLGALSLPWGAGELLRDKKRHPTIEEDVIIYSGATILGGDTVIGARSVIGGNVWVTESVPPDTKVFLKKPELVYRGGS